MHTVENMEVCCLWYHIVQGWYTTILFAALELIRQAQWTEQDETLCVSLR